MTLGERLHGLDARKIFFVGLIVASTGVISPPVALAAGLCFGLLLVHPLRRESSALAKTLLQLSVVGLGFGMNLFQIIKVGRSGFLYTAISIVGSVVFGLLLGRMLKVRQDASLLITVGTAICGGSAIAAVAPILNASEDDISIAMGTVFLLNSVALFVFPAVGGALHLGQDQFGLWAALAIHDTSSVVGAGAKYGNQALMIGTTVKLARALWIIPVSLLVAGWSHRRKRQAAGVSGSSAIQWPWFILFFCLASVWRTYEPGLIPFFDTLAHLGKIGLTATLFLIGSGLSRRTLQQVGYRPMLQGVVLWIAVATLSLLAIYESVISI